MVTQKKINSKRTCHISKKLNKDTLSSTSFTRKCQDIYGGELTFHAVSHGSLSLCNEYIIEKEAFSVKRWLFLTILFCALAFYYELYNRDSSLLGVIFILLCIIFIIKLHLKVKQESLLVMASLGLQLTTTFATGRQSSEFIHDLHILDVVINEGITVHRVIYYLAVLLRDVNNPVGVKAILPLFQNTFPRLDCLEQIYKGIQLASFSKRSTDISIPKKSCLSSAAINGYIL